MTSLNVFINFIAVILTLKDEEPYVLVESRNTTLSLPVMSFDADTHRTLESGFRGNVVSRFGIEPGYAEQLYTFGNRGRNLEKEANGQREISIAYIVLVQHQPIASGEWLPLYALFPWEDFRRGIPPVLTSVIHPQLDFWAKGNSEKMKRISMAFGDTGTWDRERAHERFEVLFDAGLIAEKNGGTLSGLGEKLDGDHRRVLSSALSRVRGKIRYRPVVFELMPQVFSLYDLQRSVESLSGVLLHKQNFRRLIEHTGLVELAEGTKIETGGRPAALYRFRGDVLFERPAPGIGPTSFPVIR